MASTADGVRSTDAEGGGVSKITRSRPASFHPPSNATHASPINTPAHSGHAAAHASVQSVYTFLATAHLHHLSFLSRLPADAWQRTRSLLLLSAQILTLIDIVYRQAAQVQELAPFAVLLKAATKALRVTLRDQLGSLAPLSSPSPINATSATTKEHAMASALHDSSSTLCKVLQKVLPQLVRPMQVAALHLDPSVAALLLTQYSGLVLEASHLPDTSPALSSPPVAAISLKAASAAPSAIASTTHLAIGSEMDLASMVDASRQRDRSRSVNSSSASSTSSIDAAGSPHSQRSLRRQPPPPPVQQQQQDQDTANKEKGDEMTLATVKKVGPQARARAKPQGWPEGAQDSPGGSDGSVDSPSAIPNTLPIPRPAGNVLGSKRRGSTSAPLSYSHVHHLLYLARLATTASDTLLLLLQSRIQKVAATTGGTLPANHYYLPLSQITPVAQKVTANLASAHEALQKAINPTSASSNDMLNNAAVVSPIALSPADQLLVDALQSRGTTFCSTMLKLVAQAKSSANQARWDMEVVNALGSVTRRLKELAVNLGLGGSTNSGPPSVSNSNRSSIA